MKNVLLLAVFALAYGNLAACGKCNEKHRAAKSIESQAQPVVE